MEKIEKKWLQKNAETNGGGRNKIVQKRSSPGMILSGGVLKWKNKLVKTWLGREKQVWGKYQDLNFKLAEVSSSSFKTAQQRLSTLEKNLLVGSVLLLKISIFFYVFFVRDVQC